MDGYYNDPEATKKAMGDGWFHSGDAAVVHPDGYVEIRDRIKDVIISGGENISSVEVEGTLLRHPAVGEAAVVGLPSERWGETPHAFVVLLAGETATESELIDFVRDRLAHFKAPRGVTFVAELPKTATGKIQKFVLRGGAANISRQLSPGGTAPAPPRCRYRPRRRDRSEARTPCGSSSARSLRNSSSRGYICSSVAALTRESLAR
jgi:fatty-acyl-CoA synthase